MSTESDTPRTDALMPDQVYKRTMYEHILVMESHARQLERELNEVTKQRDDLMTMLDKITEIAERVDGWESFPSKAIEQAHELMESIKSITETK